LSHLDRDAVKRVRKALVDAGQSDTVHELPETVRNAADAAKALGVDVGSIVKTLVVTVGNRYAVALVAGDHVCRDDQLAKVFQLQGDVVRPSADLVRAVTGFPTGGVSPVGLISKLPTAIDANLKRFNTIYVNAGHPQCVFETSVDELKTLTGGLVSYAVAAAANPS